jgi:hypothetical protein
MGVFGRAKDVSTGFFLGSLLSSIYNFKVLDSLILSVLTMIGLYTLTFINNIVKNRGGIR